MMRSKMSWARRLIALVLMLTLVCGAVLPAQAASFTSKKPTIKKTSAYVNGYVSLKWSKVSGATKYEIYRASKKSGTYKKYATSKTTSLKKKSSGTYYYKVRGVKGKQKTKFSKPVLIFAATAQIKEVGFSGTGWVGTMGTLASVKVTNHSKKDMQFLGGYYQHATLYLMNKKTNKLVGSTYMQLNTNNDIYGISISDGITIKAGKSQTLWYHVMEYTLWNQYDASPSKYYWMLSMPFYPGKGTDELVTMSISATKKKSESSVPGAL